MSRHRDSTDATRTSAAVAVLTTLLTLALGTTACSGSDPKSAEPMERSTKHSPVATSSASSGEPIGTITTVAGNGFAASSGDGGPATEASISGPDIIGFDAQGNLYIKDADVRVRKIDPSGVITTVVGPPAGGEPAPGEAGSVEAHGGAVDPEGNLYVASDGKIVKVTPSGDVSTVAGTGREGFSGDGGPATEARISLDYAGMAVDAEGNLYIAQPKYHRVRKIDTNGIITTIAGTGKPGFSGDGGPARKAKLYGPTTVSLDGEWNIYISDLGLSDVGHRIRRIDSRGIIKILAGTGDEGYSGDGGPATEAQLSEPTTVALGPDGNLYIADWGNNRIRKVVLHL